MELEELKEKLAGLSKIQLTVIASILVVMSILLFNYSAVDTEAEVFEVTAETVEVNNSDIGVVTDPKLDYGKTPPGSTVRKNLGISSDRTLMVKLNSDGNVSQYLDYPKIEYMEEGGEVEVVFQADEVGYYEGNLNVSVYTSDYSIGERWLKLRSKAGY